MMMTNNVDPNMKRSAGEGVSTAVARRLFTFLLALPEARLRRAGGDAIVTGSRRVLPKLFSLAVDEMGKVHKNT